MVLDGGLAGCANVPFMIRHSGDVNCDDVVTPRDALVVINAIARQTDNSVPSIEDANAFVDVNRDDRLTPEDALRVINTIARLDQYQADLNHARERWRHFRPQDYDLVYHWATEWFAGTQNVLVRDGAASAGLESVTEDFDHSSSIGAEAFTVEGLHGVIQNAISSQLEEISIEYDPVTGVPTSARFDQSPFIADEGYSFSVSHVESATTDRKEAIEDLATARASWSSSNTSNYDLTYTSLVGGSSSTNSASVRIDRFQSDEGDTSRLNESEIDVRNLRIEGLFDVIDYAYENDFAQVDVIYDTERGFPIYLQLGANVGKHDIVIYDVRLSVTQLTN